MNHSLKSAALVLTLFLFVTSCKKDDPAPTPPMVFDTADLITRNYLTSEAAFDWLVDGVIISEFLEYSDGGKAEFQWNADSAAVIELSINVGGTSTELFITPLTVEKDKSYFSALVGDPNTGLVILDENDQTLPTGDNVRVRFLHAYQNSGPVDLYFGGTEPQHKLVDSLLYATMSDYIEISAADLNVSIICTENGVLPDTGTNLFTIINSTIHNKGEIYIDILASQNTNPSSEFWLFVTPQ